MVVHVYHVNRKGLSEIRTVHRCGSRVVPSGGGWQADTPMQNIPQSVQIQRRRRGTGVTVIIVVVFSTIFTIRTIIVILW